MTRLRKILTGAASLVVGGSLALGVALNQSAQDEGVTDCEQWRKLVRKVELQRKDVTWWVLVQDGYAPPEAVSDRVVGIVDGDAAEGRIHVTPAACETGPEYDYQRSAAVNGWRLYRFDGDRYFARSWKVLGSDAPEVKWLGGWKGVVDACLSVATAQQCRDLLGDVSQCWRLGNGNLCRYGLEYGPGLGGVDADGNPATCSPGAGAKPYPCRDQGRGKEYAERAVSEALDVSEE